MISTLTHSRLAALLLPAAVLMAGPQTPPADASDQDESYQGEAPERYAMVRALEGEVHIRKGDLDETLTRGTPIAEGDVVESRGRGVLQLGDGTRVAFAGATRFTVAALFTDKKGEKQVLLRLDNGRLRVLLGGQSDARFRVDTPSGTATCFDKGGFTIEAERDKVVRLKVHSGRVTFSNERDEARISAGERLTVYSPQDGLDRVRSFNTYDGDDFDRWSDRAVIVQRGESWNHVPTEIRYYADELDNHGRWVHSDEFGWVWQPNGVAEDWRPYYQGRWAPYSGGMTWVSDEPWAYVAYHHGRWHWSVGIGWCWIPGVYYSPAWVAWHHTPGYYGWAPLGYYNTPCHWGYGAWGGGYAWNVVAVTNINIVNVHRHIYSDANVLRTFGGGNGGTTWRGGGGRDLGAPWQRSPLMVSRTEFRNPGQIETVFRRDVNRDRMQAYERQAQATTGRVILRDASPSRITPGGASNAGSQAGSQAGPQRVPFEDRRRVEAPRGQEVRPIETRRPDAPAARDRQPQERRPEERRPEERRPDERRPETSRPVQRPDDRSRALPERRPEERRPEERRPESAPPVQRPEERSRPQERRPEAPPARERFEERPRPTESPRPEPAPRERAPEFNFRAPREERRPDPPRSEPARESRPAPRQESRPEPARESRPAPRQESRPEPARERPREERKSTFGHEGRR